MNKQTEKREKLIEEVNTASRQMSTTAIMFHQSVAEKAGISGTDHKYLDVLLQHGEMTAGELAKKCGLTTGAVTGIIDRLENEGLVKREDDPNDRRKVLVVPQVEKVMEKLSPIFNSLKEDLDHFYKDFSDEDLKIILRFMQKINGFFKNKLQ